MKSGNLAKIRIALFLRINEEDMFLFQKEGYNSLLQGIIGTFWRAIHDIQQQSKVKKQ